MATIEKLVDDIKQLSLEEQKRLLEILQLETKMGHAMSTLRHEQKESPLSEAVDLDSIAPELKWLMENGWVLQKYRGEYIALKGNEFIAHGTLGEVLAESKRRGIAQPFTQYIPKTEREWLLGQGNYPIDEP
jgi:hypothetical protein